MRETALLFAGPTAELFGSVHLPAGEPVQRGVVLCYPFGEERLWVHRIYATFSRRLAAAGVAVIRFDYAGNGDSGGTFSDSTLETAVADASAAVDCLRERSLCGDVALVGLRFGAVVAARLAERRHDLDRLVLWAPLLDGKQYVKELLRINLTTQMTAYGKVLRDREQLLAAMRAGEAVNVDGYEMSLAMHDQLEAIAMPAGGPKFSGRCLIVNIDGATAPRPRPDLEAVAAAYGGELTTVRENPFWKEIDAHDDAAPRLASATTEWLERNP